MNSSAMECDVFQEALDIVVRAIIEAGEAAQDLKRAVWRKATRKRFIRRKREVLYAIAKANGLGVPVCQWEWERKTGPNKGKVLPCRNAYTLEVDHVHGRDWNIGDHFGIKRWRIYLEELVLWLAGDERYRLRILCRRHNAAYRPQPLTGEKLAQ